MRLLRACVTFAAVLAATPAYAASTCQLSAYLELPVLLFDERPLVTTTIAGKDARFIVDSGAFYSTISRASAIEFGLKVEPVPSGLRMRGINGEVSISLATVHDFKIGGAAIPSIDFIVGGTDTGSVGLLGQNFLGIGDVEYDLHHGMIRLLGAKSCPVGALAYWAGSKPVAVVELQTRNPPFQTLTVGTVTLNGVKLRAVFDTGAESSILTLAAAKRVGMTPDSPGVTPASLSTGIGSRAVRTWIGTFDKLDIGGEAISKPHLRFGDVTLGDGDLLIGIDFFRTHRIYVANKAAKMLLTYEGGPVFGLNPSRAVSSDGTVIDLTDKSAEPTTAEGYGRRAAVFASNGKFDAAIADFDKAAALAPGDANLLRMRAAARLARGQGALGTQDLDKALEINPRDADARLMRAEIRLAAHDREGARADLKAADAALAPSSERRLQLGAMLGDVDENDAALASLDAWLKAHPEDAARPVALNSRCWIRATANRELDRALNDCNAAIRQRPDTAAILDSRALVRLRQGDLAKALADYDAAIRLAPKQAWSLYARSVVRRRMGDTAGATADRAAALALDPGVLERGRKLGLAK